MEQVIAGRAYVLGDNIDTDQIIPAEHLVYSLSDPEEKKNYGKFALSGVPKNDAGLPEGNKLFVEEEKLNQSTLSSSVEKILVVALRENMHQPV